MKPAISSTSDCGYQYPVALEGALEAFKEISAYIHAEGYPAAEMKHGLHMRLIDENMPTVVVAPKDSLYFDKGG